VTAIQKTLFWAAAVALFILALVLFNDVLLPFVAGMALAYLLDPVADRLCAWGLPRALATSVALAAALMVLVGAVFLIVPVLEAQLARLFTQLPEIIERLWASLSATAARISSQFAPDEVDEARAAVMGASEKVIGGALAVIQGVWSSGLALVNLIGLVVVTPVVAWYLLRDWDRIVEAVDGWLPRDHAPVIREEARIIDRTLAGFVRGQAMVCLILGAVYAVALELAGLDYGLVVGLVAGLISFIPYIGAIVGLVASVGLAYAQTGEVALMAVVGAIFVAGQAIEGNFLTPKLVGGKVGLHPVWLMFALSAFGTLFGFVGLLVAVPAAAVIGVFGRFLIERYKAGSLYRGSAEWQAEAAADSEQPEEEQEGEQEEEQK